MSKSLGLFSVSGVVCGIEKRALKVGPDVHKHKHRQKYLVEKLCRVLVSLAVRRKRKRTGIFFPWTVLVSPPTLVPPVCHIRSLKTSSNVL